MKEKGGTWGLTSVESRDFFGKGWTMAVDSVSVPFQGAEGWEIIKVLQKDSARVKTYEEVLPELTSAYREYASKVRETSWVDSLKQKYGVAVRKESLAETFKKK